MFSRLSPKTTIPALICRCRDEYFVRLILGVTTSGIVTLLTKQTLQEHLLCKIRTIAVIARMQSSPSQHQAFFDIFNQQIGIVVMNIMQANDANRHFCHRNFAA